MNKITDELLKRQRAIRAAKVRKWRFKGRSAAKGGGGSGLSVTASRAAAQTSPTNTSPINFTITFSQAVTGFTSADITFAGSTVGGTLTGTITGTGPSYNVAVSGMTGQGDLRLSILPGIVVDTATGLLTNSASNTALVAYDSIAPSVTISQAVGQPDPAELSPITFTIVFSEPVIGFIATDVVITGTAGGTKLVSLSGIGPTYSAEVSGMTTAGTVIANIAAGVCTDLAGNANTISTTTDRTVTWTPDVISPSVTVNKASGQSDPTSTSPILFDIVFSEPVIGFAAADLTVVLSGGGTAAVSLSGGPTSWVASVSGMTTNGNVTVSIAAGVCTDAALNPNTASTSTDNIVQWIAPASDIIRPTVTINHSGADPTTDDTVFFSVFFSEVVTGFGPATASPDIDFSGSTVGGTLRANISAGTGDSYLVSVRGMASPTGTVVASIPANVAQDAAGNLNFASTSTDNSVTWNAPATALALPLIPWEGGSAWWEQFPVADAAGWSNPAFFPIASFLDKVDSGYPPNYAAMGVNTYVAAEHQLPISQATDDVFIIAQSSISLGVDAWTPAEIGSDPKVVGWFVADECEMGFSGCTLPTEGENLALFQGWCTSIRALNDGRFLMANWGNGILGSFWSPTTMDDHVAAVDAGAVDKYTYTSPGVRSIFYPNCLGWATEGGTSLNVGTSASYGWMARRMKNVYQTPTNQRPYWVVPEAQMPFLGEVGRGIITYAQAEGAIFSALANEARGILWFDHNGFYTIAGGAVDDFTGNDPNTGVAPNTNPYSFGPLGDAALQTFADGLHSRVTALASILNTQSFVWNFGDAANRIDTMLKALGSFAYVFASVGVNGTTGLKTFTLPPELAGATILDVVDESRTITITGGRFNDTFANEYSHHIYKIPKTSGTVAPATGPVLEFQGTASSAIDSTTQTFSLTVASAVGKERLVAIGAMHTNQSTVTITSVTIDGQAATQVGSYARSDNQVVGSGALASMWRAAGTTNTSINVVVTFSTNSCFGGSVALWNLSNAGAAFSSTTSGAAADVVPVNLNVAANNAIAGMQFGFKSGGSLTNLHTHWSGLVRRASQVAAYSSTEFTAADLKVFAPSSPLSVSCHMVNYIDSPPGAKAAIVVSFADVSVDGEMDFSQISQSGLTGLFGEF